MGKGAKEVTTNLKLKYVSLCTLTLQNSAIALSMRYARTRPGEMFIASAAVAMAEFVKLLASLYLVFYQSGSLKHCIGTLYTQIWSHKLDTLKVGIPAFIYLLQNNLLYVSASNLDAATYQVTYQMKVLTTAMFAVLILKKKLRFLQWVALIILTIGVALVQLANTDGDKASTVEQNRLLGCAAAIAACCCSGFAGIYFEKILKGSDVSIWVRNVQLSSLSLPIGVMTAFATDWTSIAQKGFFVGFDGFVVYLVVLNAVGGMLVAIVVKYADNLLKGFATSLAIILSTVCSMVIFDFTLTLQFVAGTAFVMISIFLYSHEPPKKSESGSVLLKVKENHFGSLEENVTLGTLGETKTTA